MESQPAHCFEPSVCFASVLDGIMMSLLLLSTTLKRALSFRAVELAFNGRCKSTEIVCAPMQVVLPPKEEIADVVQITHQERRPDRIAKQMADILVLPGMDKVVPLVQDVV